MARRKNLIADLPSGIGITKSLSGRGRLFYRVRLGRRFTGGPVLKKDFTSVDDARTWIFGEAQVHKAEPGAIVDLKAGAGESAFKLSAAQLAAHYREVVKEASDIEEYWNLEPPSVSKIDKLAT